MPIDLRQRLGVRIFAVLFVLVSQAAAQVNVRLRTEHRRYLLFEPIPVRVRIENEGRAPLVFGGAGANATLRVHMDLAPDRPVARTDEPVLAEPLEVPAGGAQVVRLDLLQLFHLTESGPIAVTVAVETGGAEYWSGRLLLDVLPGMLFQEFEARAPDDPEGRRLYQLRGLGRDGGEHLFLRVDDPLAKTCRGVFDLGSSLRVWKPRMLMDADGLLYILHQSAPQRLTLTIYDDVDRVARTTFFSTTNLPPDLIRTKEGAVRVINVAPYQGDPMPMPMRIETGPSNRLPARR